MCLQEMEQQLSDVRTRVIEVTEEMHDMKQMKEGESAMLAERITELEMQLQESLIGQESSQGDLLARAITSQDETHKLAAEVRLISNEANAVLMGRLMAEHG